MSKPTKKQIASRAATPCSAWIEGHGAPHDGSPFIGDFGFPWPLVALWDQYDDGWVYCVVGACEMADGPLNSYFETEWDRCEKSLKRWMPLPSLQNVQVLPLAAKGEANE